MLLRNHCIDIKSILPSVLHKLSEDFVSFASLKTMTKGILSQSNFQE